MDIPEHIESFWSDFLTKTARAVGTPLHDVFHFADDEITLREPGRPRPRRCIEDPAQEKSHTDEPGRNALSLPTFIPATSACRQVWRRRSNRRRTPSSVSVVSDGVVYLGC